MTMKLIIKDTLLGEVNRLRKNQRLDDRHSQGILDGIYAIEKFIDTLEVKEVDLEKEFSQWWKSGRTKDYNVDILYERYSDVSLKLAKYFFELGLKLNQKGE